MIDSRYGRRRDARKSRIGLPAIFLALIGACALLCTHPDPITSRGDALNLVCNQTILDGITLPTVILHVVYRQTGVSAKPNTLSGILAKNPFLPLNGDTVDLVTDESIFASEGTPQFCVNIVSTHTLVSCKPQIITADLYVAQILSDENLRNFRFVCPGLVPNREETYH